MLRSPGETLEGAAILAEIPGDLGVLLWRTTRDLALWADAPPEVRGNLFADGSGDVRLVRLASTEVPPAISASIDTISGMLSVGERADAGILSICCLEVAAWARREGLVHTALGFAQAGALTSPEFAEAALHTGIAAAAAGQDARAGTWLRRAVSLARREKDRAAYAAALVELGALYERRGNTARAENFYRLAYRAGRRVKGDASTRMRAAHGLFRLARPSNGGSAAQFALAALRAYRPHSLGGPQLLLDLARFWTEMGELGRAGVILRRLSPYRSSLTPADQLSSWALTARAFAHKDPAFSAGATDEAWRRIGDEAMPQDVRFAAALDLAHAARSAGDLMAFTRAKREVLRLAPPETFPQVSTEVAELWPDGQPAPKLDRAS